MDEHSGTMTSPLPAHHHRLRDGRYEINIARPSTKRAGSWLVHTTGRFDLHNLDAALQWAAANTPTGHRFTVTGYSARDGWTPHPVPIPQGAAANCKNCSGPYDPDDDSDPVYGRFVGPRYCGPCGAQEARVIAAEMGEQ